MLRVRCAHPSGIFAPKRPFGTFRCCAWLIKIREHTVLSYLKRSCFRFASLTLRLRTGTFFQKVPVFRMAYSAIPHHRPYGRWCFARLIRQAETLELQPHSRPPSKRTALSVGNKHMLQVRCAHPAPSHRNAPSGHSGVPHGLFSEKSILCSFLQNAHASGSLRSPYG